MKKTTEYFIVTAPGLEAICGAEAAALGLSDIEILPGGVIFRGGLSDLYRANLHLRTATRIVARVGSFGATDFPELFRKALRLPWGSFLRLDTTVEIRATAHRSRLLHTGRIAETVGAAIDRALGRASGYVGAEGFAQHILVRFEEDRCTISCDSSGELLHRRGYRVAAGPAPLRETLAAAALHFLDWNGSIPLCDPLCGSGTIPIEGALLATGRAAGRQRNFAFMRWPGFRPQLWQVLLDAADRQVVASAAPIHASDSDAGVLAVARVNAERAGVAAAITLTAGNLQALPTRFGPGLVLCNPPYGIRLERGEDLAPFYQGLGDGLRRAFPGWRYAMIAPDDRLARATRLSMRSLARLVNGGLSVSLYATE